MGGRATERTAYLKTYLHFVTTLGSLSGCTEWKKHVRILRGNNSVAFYSNLCRCNFEEQSPEYAALWSVVRQEAANFKIFFKRSLNQTPGALFSMQPEWLAHCHTVITSANNSRNDFPSFVSQHAFLCHVIRTVLSDTCIDQKMAELTPWSQPSTFWTTWSSWRIYWCFFSFFFANLGLPTVPLLNGGRVEGRAIISSCSVQLLTREGYTPNDWCKWFRPLSQTEEMSFYD